MRVVCPVCEAIYEVPDASLGGGKARVRCTRCEHEWEFDAAPPSPDADGSGTEESGAEEAGTGEADPALEEAASPGAEEPQVPPPLVAGQRLPARPDAAESPRSGRAALLGWVLSLLVIAGAAGAAVHFRAPIMQAWPASERVYAWFGAAPPPNGR